MEWKNIKTQFINNKFLAILLFGNVTTKIGNIVFNILLVKWLLEKTGTAYASGVVMGFSLLPTLIFGLFSGVIVDTFSKKYILVLTDFLNAIICFLIGLVVLGNNVNIPLLSLAVFLIGANNTLFGPAFRSILPEILGKENMVSINSIFALASQLSSVIAPMLAGVLMISVNLSITSIFLINAITFLCSSLCELMLPYKKRKEEKKEIKIFQNIYQGFSYIKGVTWLFFLLITASLVNIFIAGYDLMLPFYLREIYADTDGRLFSIALTVEAVAGIVAALVQSKFGKKINFDLWLYLLLVGISAFFIGSNVTIYLSLLGVFLFNFFLVFFNVNFFAKVQTEVDSQFIGRTFSIIFLLANLSMPFSKYIFAYVNISILPYIFTIIGLGIASVSLLSNNKRKVLKNDNL